ncbi:argonaute-like protein [Lyophyllum atratum]|nr:argonaute-like protein [Lyophyllum atratum]
MPPRIAPDRGAPRGGRGGGRPPRGARVVRAICSISITRYIRCFQVQTVGVKRPDYGTAGRPIAIQTNSFVTSIPEVIIRHYDTITPSNLHTRINTLLIKKLQHEVAADVFTPAAVYDGRKNMFAPRRLPLGPTDSREFDVTLAPAGSAKSDRPPKIYKVKVTKVNEINPEVLNSFVKGEYSHDNMVLTAIMALNVVIRMDPSEKLPFNVRSFFTDRETKDIGNGIVLWRGYFQSVRPGISRMLINVDISTGMMYKPGQLIQLCLDFLGKTNPSVLAPANGLPDRERLRLQRFLLGLKVITPHTAGTRPGPPIPRVIKKLSTAGASSMSFTLEGKPMTVAEYFRSQANRPLRYPDLLCVEVGSGALLPLELCVVPPGQIMKKQLPPEKTKDVLDFATMRPAQRFDSIRNGLGILSYGQSEYVRQFGMNVETAAGPLAIQARVLVPPILKYGQGSRQLTIQPRDGAWNMIDKKFFQSKSIDRWVVVVYERQNRFTPDVASEMVRGLVAACKAVGMTVRNETPIMRWENGQGRIADQLRNAGAECARVSGGGPNLIVVILPDGGNDIYTAVKHFGDVTMGVATQCLKSSKCFRAKPQYWANVCLKINPKLGGINTVPEPSSVAVLTDPHKPTIVMGADVIHPAPGSHDRPSFTSVVGNVDSDTAKYIATTCVQTSKQEMIDDLQSMCRKILAMYMSYRTQAEKKPGNGAPKRLIFFRDGVSEGQFQQVLDLELPLIKAACAELKINPTITIVVVGKRHHVRFMTQKPGDADRSGNCPAGTIVDREVGHPTEFDFFLQSHGGLLGTSRPAHYSVLYDENGFYADSMQALAFALCHVYARSTRSVSIPAPVYYADIVCSRAKNHYDPTGSLDLSESATQTGSQADVTLQSFKTGYKPLHDNMSKVMYFS